MQQKSSYKYAENVLTTIAMAVVTAHMLLLLVLQIGFHTHPALKKSKEQFIVKTVELGGSSEMFHLNDVAEREMVAEPTAAVVKAPEPIVEAPPPPAIVEAAEPEPEPVVEKKMEKVEEVKPEPMPEPVVEKKVEKVKPKTAVKKPTAKKEIKKKETKTITKKSTPKKVKEKSSTPPKEKVAKKSETTTTQKNVEKEKAAKALLAKQQDLLKKAKESIAKIDKSAHNFSSPSGSKAGKIAPGKIEKLQVEGLSASGATSSLTGREANYRDELVSRMKLLLRLPEYGEVRVKLTLERSGHVQKVVIVSAASATNKSYIEKTLPTITFPAFGDNFSNEGNYTFLISLSNEI